MSGETMSRREYRHAEEGINGRITHYIEGICVQDWTISHQDATDEQLKQKPLRDQVEGPHTTISVDEASRVAMLLNV